MPIRIILWILKDLLWITLLSTVSLVLLLAMGASIRPLLGDLPLTLFDIFNLIGLGSIPMMQFALPISIGFASTMLYYRLSEEREIIALLSMGIPFQIILLPALLLSIFLALLQSFVLHDLSPSISSKITQMLSEDGMRWMKATLVTGKPFKIGDLIVRADSVYERASEDPNIVNQLELGGVMATGGTFGDIGKGEVIASRAIINMNSDTNAVHLSFEKPIIWKIDSDGSEIDGALYASLTHAIEFDKISGQRTRSVNRSLMKKYSLWPSKWPSVSRKMKKLNQSIEKQLTRNWINSELENKGYIEFEQIGLSGRKYRLKSRILIKDSFKSPIEIIQIDRNINTRKYIPKKANIQWDFLEAGSFGIDLNGIKFSSLDQNMPPNFRESLALTSLKRKYIDNDFNKKYSIDDLLSKANKLNLTNGLNELHLEIIKMKNHFASRTIERWMLCFAVVPSGILGALLAVLLARLVTSGPLVIYSVAFIPSILNILLITAAEKILRDGINFTGLFLMLIGSVVSLCLSVFIFRQVARN